MLKKNFVKAKLISGSPVLGTWAIIPSAVTTEIVASCNLDFIIIDNEHGPITFETAQKMALACEAHQVSPIMRVGDINKCDIQRALDIGMHGIQVPNIETKENVLQVIDHAKYPPIGDRGFSPFTRAGNYSIESSKTLTTSANKNTLVAINVEGTNAINNIEEILEIKELDIIFVGLFDLSKALGMPGEVNHPEVLELLKTLSQKINKAGKFPGTIATSEEKMKLFLDIGLKYIVYLVDCDMLRAAYQNIQNQFSKISHELCIHH